MNRKRLAMLLLTAVVLVAGGLIAWRVWLRAPGPTRQSSGEIVAFLASPQFAQMSEKDRSQYLAGVQQVQNWRIAVANAQQGLSQTQQDQLRQNAPALFPEKAESSLQYFQLPQDQRAAFLDDFIARMRKLGAEAEARNRARLATSPATSPGGPYVPKDWADRMRANFEKTDPLDRARNAAFQRLFRERMK
jgi:hypothetical protein